MATRIALLGWGSLLWEESDAFDEWHEPWQCDGPCLKIEFSRISSSRGGALTLVIDCENGVLVRVAWCLSRRQTINDAIEDLRMREKTRTQHIGRISADGHAHSYDGQSLAAIRAWGAKLALDGIVWTDLRSNFPAKRREPFSIEAAMHYLKSLEGESKTKAVEYFQQAPSFVQTPLRKALSREMGSLASSKP